MFYVKTKITEECEVITEITDENVFTKCPECGAEIPIDLSNMVDDGKLDLFGIAVYCEKCSKTNGAPKT